MYSATAAPPLLTECQSGCFLGSLPVVVLERVVNVVPGPAYAGDVKQRSPGVVPDVITVSLGGTDQHLATQPAAFLRWRLSMYWRSKSDTAPKL